MLGAYKCNMSGHSSLNLSRHLQPYPRTLRSRIKKDTSKTLAEAAGSPQTPHWYLLLQRVSVAHSATRWTDSTIMATWLDLAKTCFESVLQGKVPSQDVLRLFVSKSLGYGIMAGACVTKLPQISAVVQSGSAVGLSALSVELETLGLLIHSTYGYLAHLPFNAYGEAAILCAQSLLLLLLVYRLSKASALRVLIVISVLTAFIASVMTGKVGLDAIRVAFDANNLVMMSARLPQIITNWRNKATGQLSFITCAMNMLGCVARIYTSMTEHAGPAMIRSYILSLVLNTTLVAQILLYAKNTRASKKAAVSKKRQ